MIDIETLSTSNQAMILTIGAIRFDRKAPIKLIEQTDHFYAKIKPYSGSDKGLVCDDNTLNWWRKQPDNIRQEAFSGQQELKDALIQLSEWIVPHKCIWTQGSFDIPILTNALEKYGLPVPWKYYNIRDSRTAYDIFNIRMTNSNNHNALQDCYNQIITLQRGFLNT